jgi:GTPase SAR1 family protein
MDRYNSIKENLLLINQDLLKLFNDAKSLAGTSDLFFSDWQNTCNNIHHQLSEEIVRVAVVGPIKSGKSTFINSLFKGDYLKRGAGVVTSIVTRVRSGRHLNAKLLFKSWNEVNSEMEQALVLFPILDRSREADGFDIRRNQDRKDLNEALGSLNSEQLIVNDSLNANSLLLLSYLNGYDKVKDLISSETLAAKYVEMRFEKHRDFVSEGSMAVYLKDVQLEIDSQDITGYIEIADCQGSDSPNPIHLAMIQDYLILTHLIIYVISSRTGIREADIKFLSMIKKMGIIDNILFIINYDFNEHESIDDLNPLIKKIEEDLSFIKKSPEVFSISALFNLFKAEKTGLLQKDRERLAQWEKERSFTQLSNEETERFESLFHHKLSKERYSLLLKNHLERLGVISAGVENWITVNQNILDKDTHSASEIIDDITQHQNRMNQILSMVKRSLEGAVQKIKNETKADIDRFFDSRSGTLVAEIIEFIKDYKTSYHKYEDNLTASGFSSVIYLAFQEFRQGLDSHMTETINPEIIGFMKDMEARIKEYLDAITSPFDSMIYDALAEHTNALGNFGINILQMDHTKIQLPDLDAIKGMAGLILPPAAASVNYTAKIKTEAFIRLGFFSLIKLAKKIFRKPISSQDEEERLAFQSSVLRMKRETERSILLHFKDYKENIKYQYIFKLVGAVSQSHYQALLDRFQAYTTDLSTMFTLVSEKKVDKEKTAQILEEMEKNSKRINEKINDIRKKDT